MSATRTVDPLLPADTGVLDGLAYTLWLPPAPQPPARAGIVVVHGADSCKESHHGFARAAVALGLAAICFDQRGHGESAGAMDARAVQDVAMFAVRLRTALGDHRAPIALRGSSMGGYLAIHAAATAKAQAVVAICPASADGLRQGLHDGRFQFAADHEALRAFLDAHDLTEAARSLTAPLLLLHAEGDEQVPVQHSRELAAVLTSAGSRLIVVPGGHHRSIQHDDELEAVSLRFIMRALTDGRGRFGNGRDERDGSGERR
ncbi:MAG TPA: alpha/beta fold hydrolase [Solirubrobacteraceae bacterium]